MSNQVKFNGKHLRIQGKRLLVGGNVALLLNKIHKRPIQQGSEGSGLSISNIMMGMPPTKTASTQSQSGGAILDLSKKLVPPIQFSRPQKKYKESPIEFKF
jgi:hypothetical protein